MEPTENAEIVTARCREVDEAVERGGTIFFPHRLTVVNPGEPFEMSIRAATIGPVMVGVLRYSNEVTIETDDLETSYEINVPLDGRFACRSGADDVLADRGTAAVFRPYGATSFSGFAGGGELVGMKIDRQALERQLEALLDADLNTPVALHSQLDLSNGPGLDWWRIARSLVDLIEQPQGLVNNSLVTRPLVQSSLTALLLAVDHPHRRRLLEPALPSSPPAVQQAVELIEEQSEEPWTVVDLARAVGMSVRTLQSGFRQTTGSTPMEHLRKVRLRRVHAELAVSDPSVTTVSEVASRWGFNHLGRFAAAYRNEYGAAPSDTLLSHA